MGEENRRESAAARGAIDVLAESQRDPSDVKAWIAGLPQDDRTVARVAAALHSRLPLFGACYRLAMFLEHHLAEAHGIAGRAVVGFVNDGSDDAYGYHAWFEASGRITDVALCRPQHPSRQQAGPLVILGRRMGGGHPWAYHHERPPEGTAAVRALARTPVLGSAITAAEDEHARMASVAASPSLVRGYLDRAPDGWDYRRLAALVEEGA